jgi:enoyl-CoA hydratase
MPMLRVEMHGAVAVVTLERPPANALNRDFFVELAALLARLAVPEIRGVVFTGSGRFFSAGLDLFEILGYDDATWTDFTARFDAGYRGLFGLAKPVVAAVNGHAIAGGAVLAACADVRLMAEGEGQVGLTEIRVGVPFPSAALEPVRFSCAGPHLPELLYRGLTYGPAEACFRRLVDEVVPEAALAPRALALAGELAAHPPTAFASSKRTLRAEALARMEAAHVRGADPVWATWRTPETRAAIEAFRTRTLHGGARRPQVSPSSSAVEK